MLSRLTCLLTLLITTISSAENSPAAPLAYPETPQHPETLQYGTIQLVDAFTWLEEDEKEEVENWFRAQNDFARSQLNAIETKQGFYDRIKEIDEAKTVQIYSFNRAGERYFHLKEEVGDEVASLYYRDGVDGESSLILDPATFLSEEGVQAIDFYSPSPDGVYVAVGIATGGSEIPDVYIIRVESGEHVGIPVPRVRSTAIWLEDASGYYYVQLRPDDPNEAQVDKYSRQPVKFHRLGTDPAEDPVVVSFDQYPFPVLSKVDTPYVAPVWQTDLSIGYVSHGVDNALTLFYTRNLDPEYAEETEWMQIAGREDSVEDIEVHEERFFLRSTLDAPRGKILMGSFDNASSTELILPESDIVLTGMTVGGDFLYLTGMRGGIDVLLRMDLREKTPSFEEMDLPLIGRVTPLANDYREKDFWISLTSWTQAPAYYRIDPESGEIKKSSFRPLGPYDAPENLVVRRVHARSHDGAQVPLTIMHRDDLKLDGSNPTILYGYGAYGISLRPSFSPLRLSWFEQGGVYVIAHVRGGGEYGKDWHDGGHLESKRNSWLDFHACADFLITEGYTSEGMIGGMGGSMGGVLVGRAMTSRPDLYGAIVSRVGNHNPVRNHRRANGPANYPEYGNPFDTEEFPYTLAMDSYFAVQEDTQYPPMLLTSGYNDARVDPWMPGKMAARLQTADPKGGPFLLRIEFNAGHGGVARSDIWDESADVYAFFLEHLSD